MTDSSPRPNAPGVQIQPAAFVQIPCELLQFVRTLKLTGTQYDLWLYLYALDPYGDRFINVPPPQELAILLQVNPRTIERAAQRLADCQLFEFEIERWKAKNNKRSICFPQFSLDKEIQMSTNRSKCRRVDQFVQTGISLSEENKTEGLKPAQGKPVENDPVPIVLNTCLKTTEQPTTHPVAEPNEQENLDPAQLLDRIEKAGFALNKTIRKTIGELCRHHPAAAAQAVENALSAVSEQMAQGTVRNPAGLLVTALRRGYTANAAKRKGRDTHSPAPAPPADWMTIEWQIDQSMIRGDRQWSRNRLQQLWQEGWRESVEELCHLRRDWRFQVTLEGVSDAP